MKIKMKKQSNLIAMPGYHFLAMVFVLSMSLIVPATVMAAELVSYEGTIQGANCVHNKTRCPEDNLDAHIALEQDFLLLLPNDKHYFLPNLDRAIKARYVTKAVRISGEQEGDSIWVDSLEVKEGSKYRRVWSLKQQQEMYKGGGG